MLTIVKLVVLTVFMILSSKSIGELILEKINKKTDETLGIGFLANLSLFWILEFFVMFFKLSAFYLNAFGIIYLLITSFVIVRNIIKYKNIKFTKKEIIAILITIILMIIYCLFVHFGYIETYDSYFYSVLTNSASDTNNISVIDPYTGQENLQNYYKYISYYYQATFLGNMIDIEDTYLVLIWVMTFMNYLFISITVLTVVRITKNKYINNILSAFLFTFLTSIFRAPFNALHLVTMIIPIYCFKYMFEMFNKEKSEVLLLISIIATVSITSTSLFVILPFLYVFFVVASILDRREMYIKILSVGIPVIILAFLYIYESLDSYIPLMFMIFMITSAYLLLLNKKILKILSILGKISIIVVIFALIAIGILGLGNRTKNTFTKSDAVQEENLIGEGEQTELEEITYENKDLKLNYEFDKEKHSSSMHYIYSNNQSLVSKILILGTHSTVLYGGMLILLLYGIIKKRKIPEFIALCVYIVAFYNPLVKKGLSEIALNLENRIYLFFNTIFALYGIKYLLEIIYEKFNKKYENIIEKTIKYGNALYIICVVFSIVAYISNFKAIDFKNYNLIYKVPNSIIETQEYIDNNIKTEGNARIFYTANTFNISMIDKNVNNKIKIINSKEYMGYFESRGELITDKIVISAFWDSEGQATITNKENEKIYINKGRVEKLINYFNIEYIVCKKTENEEFIKYIQDNYEVMYSNNEIQVLKVI